MQTWMIIIWCKAKGFTIYCTAQGMQHCFDKGTGCAAGCNMGPPDVISLMHKQYVVQTTGNKLLSMRASFPVCMKAVASIHTTRACTPEHILPAATSSLAIGRLICSNLLQGSCHVWGAAATLCSETADHHLDGGLHLRSTNIRTRKI